MPACTSDFIPDVVESKHIMTRAIQNQGLELWQCRECGLRYEEKEWAERCEDWCKANHSCNLEITSHSVEREKKGSNSPPAKSETRLS
jgi:hypothetical protein